MIHLDNVNDTFRERKRYVYHCCPLNGGLKGH